MLAGSEPVNIYGKGAFLREGFFCDKKVAQWINGGGVRAPWPVSWPCCSRWRTS